MKWKPIKTVDWIIVHCAATMPSMDIGFVEINKWHMAKGWFGIGYHYVIRRNGVIEKGRPETRPGAHVRGLNEVSLGICLVGGSKEGDAHVAEENFTRQQMQSLESLIEELEHRYPNAPVIGHRDVPNVSKICPSFDVMGWYEDTFDRNQYHKKPGTYE